jgi:hypothetical protein
LYEDEQGRIQNKLEEWWVKLRDQEDSAISRHAAFMRAVARLATHGFDRVFGERIFSFRALWVSGCQRRRRRWLDRPMPAEPTHQSILGKLKKLMPSRRVSEFLLRCVLAYIVYLSLLLPFVRPSKESEVWGLGILFAIAVGYAWTRLRRESPTGRVVTPEKSRRSARQ